MVLGPVDRVLVRNRPVLRVGTVDDRGGCTTLREARSPLAPILLPENTWIVAAAVLTTSLTPSTRSA